MSLSKRPGAIITDSQARGRIRPADLADLSQAQPPRPTKRASFKAAEFYKGKQAEDFKPQFGQAASRSKRAKADLGIEDRLGLLPDEIRTQILAEAEAIKQQARQEGLQQGLEAGRKQTEEEVRQSMAQMAKAAEVMLAAAEEIKRLRPEVLARLEREIVSLVILAASKVVGQEIKTNQEVVAGVVASALAEIRQGRSIKIKLNPQEMALIEEMRPRILAEHPNFELLELEADPEVSKGGCLILTEAEEIDSTIQVRLDSLGRIMDQALKRLTGGA